MEPEKNDDKGKGRLLPVPADRVVRQSNRLIEAQYELTLIEKRFMIYLMSVIAEADKDYDWYRVDLPALSEAFPNAHRDYLGQFRSVARSLRGKEVVVEDPSTGVVKRFNWLTADEVDAANRSVRVSIHPELKGHLIELRKIYTTYSIANVSRLRSTYSLRLYELLKQVQKLRGRTFDPDKLRRMMGAESYGRYSNFKQRVLDPAVAEVNEHTDIWCEYEAKKKGKSVVELRFTVEPNEKAAAAGKAAAASAAGELGRVRALLTERYEFSDAEADAILEARPESYVRENLEVVEAKIADAAALGKPVRNPTAYARKALEEDWRPKAGSAAAESLELTKRREAAAKERAKREEDERLAAVADQKARDAAWERHMAKPEADRAAERERFARELEEGTASGGEFVLAQWRANGLESAGVKASFRAWLAKK